MALDIELSAEELSKPVRPAEDFEDLYARGKFTGKEVPIADKDGNVRKYRVLAP